MATDPVRRVREQTYDLPVTFGVREALSRLAALPPSLTAPYPTITLDWRPEGSSPGREPASPPRRSERRAQHDDAGVSRRPARQEIERDLAKVVADYGPRGEAFDSVSADVARIAAFLDDELDPAAHGVYIAACAAQDVFETLSFALPLPTRLTAAPAPALLPLAQLVDDFPAYAALVVDQRLATLSIFRRAARGKSVSLEGSLYPRKQQQGGPSQRRFQARAEERVAAFAREIAAETAQTLDEAAIDDLIVAGNEVMTSALHAAFPPAVARRVLTTIRLDVEASEQDILAATLPLVTQAERDEELATARRLVDAVGADNRAVFGADDVLRALQAGQVSTLIMADDFAADGWADYGREMYGVGPLPAEHPLGGDLAEMTPVDLVEVMTRLALRTGAEIAVIHAAVPPEEDGSEDVPQEGAPPPRSEASHMLEPFGGVGALLRFTVEAV